MRGGGPGALLCLLLAACQPQARRLLLLDLALSDPVALNGTAQPWRDAGYTVEYRRFYPHLTWSDLARYRTVVLLCGREPEAPSDAITAGDLALLNEWVGRGNVVVLGYAGDAEGRLDRWTVNRWLASRGAGLSIGDLLLEDTTAGPAALGYRPPWAIARSVGGEPLGAVYDSFPLDRNHVVAIRDQTQVLAATSGEAFVRSPRGPTARPGDAVAAATRLGEGLVVVLSRHALGALSPQDGLSPPLLQAGGLAGTRAFLTALARWTRRPAEWAHVPRAARGAPLRLRQTPVAVELGPPRLAPPMTAGTVELPRVPYGGPERAAAVPDWLRQQGARVLWVPLFATRDGRRSLRSEAGLDSVVSFLDGGGFNLVAGDAAPEWADSARARWDERDAARRAWSAAARAFGPTSVAWVPMFTLGDARLPRADSSRGALGESLAGPCALDSTLWADALGPAYGALGRLAAEQRTLVIAVGLDLGDRAAEPRASVRRGGWGMGQEFCNAAWLQGLTRIARRGDLDMLPYGERYRALRDAGLLARYYGALGDLVAERATALRDRVLRQRPDLYFALRLAQPPTDWFSLGLLRGFALGDRPLLLLTAEAKTVELLTMLRGRGINAVNAVQLSPALLRTSDLVALRRVVFTENDGFWLAAEPGALGAATSGSRGGRVVGGRARGVPAAGSPPDALPQLLRKLSR